MDLRWVNPNSIQVPDVRLTSEMDPETLAMFRESVHESGLLEPVAAVEEAGVLILVNGLHRLQAAVHERLTEVPVIVKPGTLQGAMLENLQTSNLHGKPKPTEVRKVIKALEDEYGMDSDELVAKTGFSRAYVEQLMVINRAHADVQEALDQGAIRLGHAAEIARVEDEDAQLNMLQFVIAGRMSVENLRLAVREYLRATAPAPAAPEAPAPRQMPMIACDACKQPQHVSMIRSMNLCPVCFGGMIAAAQRADALEEGDQAP